MAERGSASGREHESHKDCRVGVVIPRATPFEMMTEKITGFFNPDRLLFLGSLTGYLLVGAILVVKPSGYPIFMPARPTHFIDDFHLRIAQVLWWSAGPLEGLVLLTIAGLILRKLLLRRGAMDGWGLLATGVLALLFLVCWGGLWWCDAVDCM